MMEHLTDINRSLQKGRPLVKFGDMVENVTVRIDPTQAETDVYVGLEHLDPESLHLRQWGSPTDVTGQKFSFKKGDIIFGRRRAYQRKLAVAHCDGICSAHALVVRAKPKVADSDFLPFFMQSDMFMERAIGISVGSLSPTINWRDLRIQEFPLPPLEEQKRIAEILWAADEAVERYASLSGHLNAYSETLIEKNLTPANVISVLGDYCPSDGIKIGPFGSLLHAEDYQSEGVPVIMPADIENGVVQEERVARISTDKATDLQNYRLCENDILFPRRGDLTKRALVSKHQENWLCGTGTIRVRLKEGIDPRAVFWAVTSASTNRWLDRFSVGTTMPNLNATTIKKIPFYLPKGAKANELLGSLERTKRLHASTEGHYQRLVYLKKRLTEYLIVVGTAHA